VVWSDVPTLTWRENIFAGCEAAFRYLPDRAQGSLGLAWWGSESALARMDMAIRRWLAGRTCVNGEVQSLAAVYGPRTNGPFDLPIHLLVGLPRNGLLLTAVGNVLVPAWGTIILVYPGDAVLLVEEM
jgi:hypothetical protein